MSRIAITILLICFGIAASFGQDTAKRKASVHPAPKHKTYKYRGESYHRYKADSAAKATAALPQQQQPPATADTAKPAATLTDKSLNGQYQYLLTKVYHYQQPLISALWKNASDTLNANRSRLKAALNKINAQNKMIDSLKTGLSNQDQALSATNARKDGVDIFGFILPKTTYNMIVWGLIAVFAITATVVIARSAGFKREARYRTQLYAELEEEFKTYKTKANDKEKKLARELQTERNKLDELLGRG